MEIALILVRIVLAAVFAVASLTKLRDLPGSRAALTEFGVPTSLVRPLGVLLPIAELAVAIGLLPASTAAWASLGALALLLLFTAAIVVNLMRGRRPACRCFGQLSAGPVGRGTVVRNGVLTTLAGLLVWQSAAASPASLLDVVAGQTITERSALAVGALLAGALLVAFWLLAQVIKQQGRLLLRIDELEQRLSAFDGHAAYDHSAPPLPEGLEVGAPAPDFALRSLTGEVRALSDLLHPDRPLILVFTDPACGPCTALLPEIGGWQRALEERVDIAVIGRGAVEANRARAVEHGVSPVLLQQHDEVADAYGVLGTPGAVLVRPDRTIGSPIAGGPEPIRSLVMHTATYPSGPAWSPLLLLPMAEPHVQPHTHESQDDLLTALPVGSQAPEFALPDLDGRLVQSPHLQGQPTLLLFWNPGCGFCHQLLPAMLAWEAKQTDDTVRLVVISEGSVEANRALGFRASVLRDDTLTIGMQFGVAGTPSALLVAADGTVASGLAVGGAQVLGVATAAQHPDPASPAGRRG